MSGQDLSFQDLRGQPLAGADLSNAKVLMKLIGLDAK